MLETMSDMVSLAVLVLVTAVSLLFFIHIVTGKKKRENHELIHTFYEGFNDESSADEQLLNNKNQEG